MPQTPTTTEAIAAKLTERTGRGYLALSDLMDFDRPIVIGEDGTITDAPSSVRAPELWDGALDSPREWEMMNGYSGQHGYAGPVMHDSEFIGGGMARDILETPGTYVALVSYYFPEDGEDDDDGETIIEGWAVARLID